MARRPAGLKATPAGGASAAPNIPAGSKQPRVPAGSKQPKPAARPKPSPNPEPPEPPASPRPKPAPAAQRPEPSPRPGLTPLVALRLSAAALALEALGLAIAAVFAVVSTVGGHAYQLAGGIAAILIALATASGLGGIAVCLATARAWTRIPTALTQVFVIIVGITLLQGHRLEWGVPALALAATCLAGLLTPASLRALNRPPTETAKDS
ncbi:MAG TPA: hypothetical protein VIX15_02805 [Streptosporangiaceae bacterium]